MKSWRSRIGVCLAVGAAVIAVPLTATAASATPPPGDGWHIVGGWEYKSIYECLEAEIPYAVAAGYTNVWCDMDNRIVDVYYHR